MPAGEIITPGSLTILLLFSHESTYSMESRASSRASGSLR
jgi:hypothetical protein